MRQSHPRNLLVTIFWFVALIFWKKSFWRTVSNTSVFEHFVRKSLLKMAAELQKNQSNKSKIRNQQVSRMALAHLELRALMRSMKIERQARFWRFLIFAYFWSLRNACKAVFFEKCVFRVGKSFFKNCFKSLQND